MQQVVWGGTIQVADGEHPFEKNTLVIVLCTYITGPISIEATRGKAKDSFQI